MKQFYNQNDFAMSICNFTTSE